MCEACGGPIPLGKQAQVRCPYCDKLQTLPEEYVALQKASQIGEGKQAAQQLLATLGRPLSFAEGMVVSAMPNGLTFGCLFLLIYLFVMMKPLFWVMGGMAWAFDMFFIDVLRANPMDCAPTWAAGLLFTLPLLAGFAGPILWLNHTRRKLETTRLLQSALEAVPPKQPGAPSRCHQCGGALDEARDEFGVVCVYCGAVNLTSLPPGWASMARRGSNMVLGSVDDARAAFARLSATLRDALYRELAVFAGVCIFVTMIAGGIQQTRFPPPWHGSVHSVPRYVLLGGDTKLGMGTPQQITLQPHGQFWIALRHRETVRLLVQQTDPPMLVPLTVCNNVKPLAGNEADHTPLQQGTLASGQTFEFTAPLSGWYRFDVNPEQAVKATVQADVRRR